MVENVHIEDAIDRIRKDILNIPDEVIKIWLLPHLKRFQEWPPKIDNEWRYILGNNRDLQSLKKTTWIKKELRLSPEIFSIKGLESPINLFRTHILNENTVFSCYEAFKVNSFLRFESCKSFLKEKGYFPKPVILEDTLNGFEILDGNHRMTAFFYLYGFFKCKKEEVPSLNLSQLQTVWIGNFH